MKEEPVYFPPDTLPKAEQLFVLPDMSDMTNDDWEAIQATFLDMVELGIARLPYRAIDIVVRERINTLREDGSDSVGVYDVESSVFEAAIDDEDKFIIDDKDFWTFDRRGACGYIKRLRKVGDKEWIDYPKFMRKLEARDKNAYGDAQTFNREFAATAARSLVVFLGTKNIVKTTKENKLLKFGIGKQKHRYVTTLKVGRIYITEYERGEPSGRTMRAHLRRGHIRRQRYGPDLTYEKKILIEPVFVNSDREYIPRERYNVSGMNHEGLRASDVDIRRSEGSEVLRPAVGAGGGQDEDRHPDR